MIYCDSSFLIALYRKGDAFHEIAAKLLINLKQEIAFTLLCEHELHNGVYRCMANRLIDRREHDMIFRQIADDVSNGILIRKSTGESDLYAAARQLAKKYTPELSSRSLDILHVAAAQLLGASPFLSFDAKQRVLVKKIGTPLLPRSLPQK